MLFSKRFARSFLMASAVSIACSLIVGGILVRVWSQIQEGASDEQSSTAGVIASFFTLIISWIVAFVTTWRRNKSLDLTEND